MPFYAAPLVAILFVCGIAHGQRERLIVRNDPDDPSRVICDITFATFTTPKGWQPSRSNGASYVILTRVDEAPPKLTQMISIDVGKPAERTAGESAAAFAKKWGGKVDEAKADVDNVAGFHVVIPPDSEKLRPTHCIVIHRDGRVFFLIGGAREDGDLKTTLDEVVATWKWSS